MKLLYIYKSEPDETTKVLAKKLAEGNQVVEFKLFGEDVDYGKLLDLVFEVDKVVTWW